MNYLTVWWANWLLVFNLQLSPPSAPLNFPCLPNENVRRSPTTNFLELVEIAAGTGATTLSSLDIINGQTHCGDPQQSAKHTPETSTYIQFIQPNQMMRRQLLQRILAFGATWPIPFCIQTQCFDQPICPLDLHFKININNLKIKQWTSFESIYLFIFQSIRLRYCNCMNWRGRIAPPPPGSLIHSHTRAHPYTVRRYITASESNRFTLAFSPRWSFHFIDIDVAIGLNIIHNNNDNVHCTILSPHRCWAHVFRDQLIDPAQLARDIQCVCCCVLCLT